LRELVREAVRVLNNGSVRSLSSRILDYYLLHQEPDERIVALLHSHWVGPAVLVGPLITVVVVLAAGVVPDGMAPRGMVPAVAVLAVVVAAWRLARWWRLRLVVTSHRFMRASGLLRWRIRTWPITVAYSRVRYVRGPVGQLLGYGSMAFYPDGRSLALRLRFVPRPNLILLFNR